MRLPSLSFPLHDVIRCRVHQRDGRRWYTITNTNNQRSNASPPSTNSSTNSSSNSTDTPTRGAAVEVDADSNPAPSFPNKVEPFDLPRVVIDLDAVDSPYVVTANPRRIQSRVRAHHMEKPLHQQNLGLKFGATHPEVLAYALLGDSIRSDTLQSKYMRRFLRVQRLHTTSTEQDHINELALNLQLNPVEGPRDEILVVENRIGLVSDIVELRRIVDILSTTLEGCRCLNLHLAAAAKRTLIKNQAKDGYSKGNASNLELLVLLNNTCINMVSRGLTPHPHLANFALYHASKCESLPAIRQYLPLSNGQKWEFGRAMRHLQLCLVDTKKSAGPATNILPWMGKEVRERECLKLLTGWEDGRKPTQGESRGLSFALLAPGPSPNHGIYIVGLGELGLCETLDVEWKNVYQENDLSKILLNSQLFAMAHLVANNPRTAASILAAVPKIRGKSNLTSVHQQVTSHSSIELLLCDVPEAVKSLIFQHYNFHGVRTSPELYAHCWRTIERVQHLVRFNSIQASRELNSLLVLGFFARSFQGPLTMTWGDIPEPVKADPEETSLGEIQDPVGMAVENSAKYIGDKAIPGLSSGMCELLKIREWSELSEESEGSVLRGLVVPSPTNGPPVYTKPFVRS